MPRPVAAPINTPTQAGSLITTATVVPDERLIDGLAFKPELCVSGTLLEFCPDEPVTKTLADGEGPVTVPAYGWFESDRCSTLAGRDQYDETVGRLTRAVENHTSFWAETALWDGLGTMTGSAALAATGADDITAGTPVGVLSGVSLLIGAMNAVLGGSRGIVHVAQSVIPFLDFYGLVTRNGSFLQVTGTDHNIVAGTGYSGDGPDGDPAPAGETWIYGTGPVNVHQSSVQILGDTPGSAIDRSTNTIEVRAERGVAAYFNPCAHIAAQICLTDPYPCEGS